jgi:acyl transferase domain-containing protein/acyl carrier protein
MEIAVIGMAGRFPGARHLHQFWSNLKDGKESITFFTDEELKAAGVPRYLISNPHYIKALGVLENFEYFDASFFGYTPREAEIMDPQTRVFHECAWAALEDAGYDPGEYDGLIGLYAGATHNLDWEGRVVLSGKMQEIGSFAARQLTQKDYLNLRISYKLNLRGSSVSLYTTCSTALVAIHLASQVLLNGECDMALAGGVKISMIGKGGYLYQEGMVLSPDGHCRAFDAAAKGTNPGEGLGVVVLKTLADARQDNDHIYALIKGSAINNDGIRKAGFAAASVEGQAEVIKMALQVAEVEPQTIGYIETHGTGTPLGDPVEMEALTLAFNTEENAFCAVGSVKTNVGHLDAAAGVVGFMKAVLVLKHRLIPPSINFEIPNPNIDFINSPFYVNTTLSPWEKGQYPLRAGVSSFGMGGTNAHVILEEAPEGTGGLAPLHIKDQLILLSAKTPTALEQMKKNLVEYLRKNPDINIANVTYSLQVGRRYFSHRWMAVCDTREEMIAALTSPGGGEAAVVTPGWEHPETANTGNTKPALDRESMAQLGRLWLQGHKIDWQQFYSPGKEKRRRVPLPTYPFERQRYWIDVDTDITNSEALIKKQSLSIPDMADWFYVPTWKRAVPERRKYKDRSIKKRWLVLVNRLNLGTLLVKQLKEKKQDVIIVEMAHEFGRVEDNRYTIDPKKSDHYDALFKELQVKDGIPDKILHLWGITEENEIETVPAIESFNETQYRGFFSLLYMVKALGKQHLSNEITITVLTNHVQEVTGKEPLHPGKSTVLGLLKSIPQEYPGLWCSAIDIALPEPGSIEETGLIEALLEELTAGSVEPVVAYRNNRRWVQIFEPLHLEEVEEKEMGFREQGVYLVTGGLGNIGLMFSHLLVHRGGGVTRLILIGRSAFPAGHEWNQWLDAHDASDPVSLKIKQLQKLEEMGGQVLYLQADVANPDRMRNVIAQSEETFGTINGVIHASGIIEGDSMRTLQQLSDDDCWLQFQTKVYGTLILEELFKDKHLDFCWMLSSISCVLGGLGFGAYASANLFMDVLVKKNNQLHPSSPHWFSLNWDGMEAKKSIAVFERMFPLEKIDQMVVSNVGNLHQRIDKWIKLETFKGKESTVETKSDLYPRPDLSTPYVAPRDAIEQALVNVWQSFLGFEQIGVHDDFLELGGDSLSAITVISRIHRGLHVNVPVTEFFNEPTIEAIARYISTKEKEDTYLSIEPVEKKEFYPVSLAQRRLFILQQMDMASISYNMSLVYTLVGEFDQKEMENSFIKLIHRHESLKTSFDIIANEPIQRIRQHVDFKLEYHGLVSAVDDHYSTRDIIKNFVRPFDLSQPPLFRAGLIHASRVGGQENTQNIYLLMVDMHHIISDGISLQIMLEDFMMLYEGGELSSLPIQNKDFAQWQNRETIKEKIKKQEEFWLKQFEGDIPKGALPTDYDTPDNRVYPGDSIYFEIDENKTAILKELAVTEGATVFMVVLAIVNILLWKISGQEDIVIGTGVDIRKDEAQRQIIGMFINTLALRFYLKRDKTFKNFLKDVKKKILLAFENQDYPYESLVEKVVPQRDRERGRNPLFDMFITSQNIGVKEPDKAEPVESQSPGFNLERYPYQNEAVISIFDIGMRYIDAGDKLGFAFDYSIGLFKKETIKKFIGYFNDIAAAVTGNLDSQLKDIKVTHALLTAETHIIDDIQEDFKF